MLFIAPHRIAFPTARRLKEQLDCRIIKFRNSRFDWNRNRGVVINWGRSDIPTDINRRVINRPEFIRNASNKIRFLNLCEENDIPAPRILSSTECEELLNDGKKILIRDPQNFGGRGIDVIRDASEFTGIPNGKFAVRFFPKRTEYRVHVFNGQAIATTQKRARRETERTDDQRYIWNHSNGWVHCRDNVEHVDGLEELAIRAVEVTGLDFGAVDLMLNRDGELRVLEVNTAPGIDGQMVDAYVEAIRNV